MVIVAYSSPTAVLRGNCKIATRHTVFVGFVSFVFKKNLNFLIYLESYVFLDVHHLILFQRLVRSILGFQQHRPALQALQTMPLILLYIQHNPTRHHIYGICKIALFIIEVLLKMPTNANTRLRSVFMSVSRHHRPWLQRIQHPLRPVISTVAQIQVAAKPRRLLRLLGQLIKYLFRNNQPLNSSNHQTIKPLTN